MDILHTLKELSAYYDTNRQLGHSTLMKEGTDNYVGKKLVLLVDQKNGENLGIPKEDRVTVETLGRLWGTNAPLAVDNFVLSEIFRETSLKLEGHKEELDDALSQYRYEKFVKELLESEISQMKKHPFKTFFKSLWQLL